MDAFDAFGLLLASSPILMVIALGLAVRLLRGGGSREIHSPCCEQQDCDLFECRECHLVKGECLIAEEEAWEKGPTCDECALELEAGGRLAS
jgi:hypothetical protein